jgi:hypothetical protein
MKFVIIIVIAFVLLIPVGMSYAESETLDFENCEGILTVDELKNAIKHIEDITVRSRGLTPVDEVVGFQTMCDSTFELLDKSISMAIVVMDSSDTASTLYKENLDSFSGGDFEIREYVTFWNNFDVTVNDQNVGSFMISQYDKFFINFHTSFDKDNPSLVDADELRILSTIVQKKILDLDDVSISPPNPLPDNDVGPTTDEPPPKPSPAPIEEGELLSPRKQVSQGIESEAVVCNEGLVLIIRHNGSPACLKEKTAEIFEERGWGSIPPPCCKPTMVSLATNFEECIAEGNPAMESYPRQCRTTDGKHFVESIPENKECEMSGGLWGIWGNSQSAKESCNPSTSDVGMECSDSSQCQSFCQAKEGSEINSESIGMCYGYELAICMQEVQNGVVQNEWCQ